MLFDLKKFLQTGRTPYRTELQCELSGFDWPGYRVEKPVKVSFTAVPAEQGAALRLCAEARVQAECARCLEPLDQPYSIKREWLVNAQQLDSEEFELPITPKGELDLDELVFEELVMEVPPVLLCSADCLGLCPVCGTHKAAGCSCCQSGQEAPADARLAILKQLLD